jgi:hypothetical protein
MIAVSKGWCMTKIKTINDIHGETLTSHTDVLSHAPCIGEYHVLNMLRMAQSKLGSNISAK